MDVVSGEANRNDNRDGEAFVFDAVEKRTPVSDNIAVNKKLAGRSNGEVGGEKSADLVVLDAERLCFVRELYRKIVRHLPGVDFDVVDLIPEVNQFQTFHTVLLYAAEKAAAFRAFGPLLLAGLFW